MECVGRHDETRIMRRLLKNKSADFVAVTGRRRVGKTYLIKEVYKKDICFELTGTKDGLKEEQLANFTEQIQHYTNSIVDIAAPKSWQKAFVLLRKYIESIKTRKKKVIFFDEIPWLSSHRSGFLQALDYFWNSWACNQKLLIIICGSATSWIIDKVINNKGGLHNRVTKMINLLPFDLKETEEYLKSRKVNLDRYQITQLYMITGGIPHYLKEVEPGLSSTQNIDNICYKKNGILKDEFKNLYQALFDNPDNHELIVRALSKKWIGLTRLELVKQTKLKDGGSFTKLLKELELSGFISSYMPFDKKKKGTIYRLTDEYSLFYLRFIEKKRYTSWTDVCQLPTWKSWSGFAFESLCIKHSANIKRALGISGISSLESSYYKKADNSSNGFQIDMLIDRKDKCINLCEMKFYDSEFHITKDYAKQLRNKIARFREYTNTRKHVYLTLISTFGIEKNENSLGLIDQNIVLNDLF